MKLDHLIKDKHVLFIPIVSMRSYETNFYNVFADGNINRVLYKIKKSNCQATVTLPKNSTINSIQDLNAFCSRLNLNINFEFIDFYGVNAKETRTNEAIPNLPYDDFDYIVVEPNYLCLNLLRTRPELSRKIIFWNLVSTTINKDVPFVKEYDKINFEICEKCITFYATKSQLEFYERGYVDSDLFDVMEEKKTIFLPFRLSDPGYHIPEIKIALENLSKKYNFTVLYTDVNDSGILTDSTLYKRVSSDRDVYNTILKSKPIIPMLEDIDEIMHMSIFEFKHFDCKLVMFKQHILKLDNVLYIKNIDELEGALEKWLK